MPTDPLFTHLAPALPPNGDRRSRDAVLAFNPLRRAVDLHVATDDRYPAQLEALGAKWDGAGWVASDELAASTKWRELVAEITASRHQHGGTGVAVRCRFLPGLMVVSAKWLAAVRALPQRAAVLDRRGVADARLTDTTVDQVRVTGDREALLALIEGKGVNLEVVTAATAQLAEVRRRLGQAA